MHVTFTFISDPGHGWLKITAADLASVGLTIEDISRYSYYDSSRNLYLEEDCDASKFMLAYLAKYGVEPVTVDQYHRGDCFVRRLARVHG